MAYIKKVEVREFAKKKDMRVSGDVFDALDRAVEDLLRKATERAKANGRKTVKNLDI